MTFQDYSIESLDEVQAEITTWYGDVASPFIKAHRDQVYQAAIAEAEEKYGALLETCDEGTACRDTIMNDLKTNMIAIWKKVIDELRVKIKSSVKETEDVVEDVWDKLVQC
jgi:Zn-dependent M32 family carboxypeptidase